MTKRTFLTLLMSAGLVGSIFAGSATAVLAADKVIKIGGLFPMSGPGSYFGVQDKQGVELALEQLNKTGVNGYKFEVKYEDSSCSPLPATQAAKRLLDQFKPDVVIGEECSDATLAVMPIMEQAKVPLLNAGSSAIKITDPGNPWTFRIMPNEVMQGVDIATQGLQAAQCTHGRAAARKYQCRHRQRSMFLLTRSQSSAAKFSPTLDLAATSMTLHRLRPALPVLARST